MFQVGLWDQVLGMEQIGPICFSALSSGGGLWKYNVFVLLSFVLFGNVPCWMYWRQLSAWASESMLHCPDLCVVLKQPGGRRCSSDDNDIGSNSARGLPAIL